MILAQEMRPKTFEDVIGNTHITEPLRKQLASGTLSQSIMITGETGTGKTTIAHIISNELAAEVQEIDCGSEGSIEVVRGLIESSRQTSLFAQNKVFILDEIHKLSNPGQSALLKTLEDQRKGVYFILLTNEPTKVLKTIRTRCIVYETALPGVEEIGVAVNRVLEKYDITVENRKDFWGLIEQAEGSLRQVYSLLEKLIAVTNDDGLLTSVAFNQALGVVNLDEDEEPQLARSFKNGKIVDVLTTVRELRKGSIAPMSQAHGVYNYMKAVYMNGTQVNTDLMVDLAELISTKTADWIDFERLAWKYLTK